jgi:hypothetical protein
VYVLVLLHDPSGGPSADAPPHEPFIDSLIARNVILLGGTFRPPLVPGVTAAYLLNCGTLTQAHEIVSGDPLIMAGAATATICPWDLVGINPAAIDPALAVHPDSIQPPPA